MARLLGGVEVDLEVFDRLQRTEDVAVPQEPLQSLHVLRHLCGQLGMVA